MNAYGRDLSSTFITSLNLSATATAAAAAAAGQLQVSERVGSSFVFFFFSTPTHPRIDYLARRLQGARREHSNGAFLDSCSHHCGQWNNIRIEDDLSSSALAKFFSDVKAASSDPQSSDWLYFQVAREACNKTMPHPEADASLFLSLFCPFSAVAQNKQYKCTDCCGLPSLFDLLLMMTMESTSLDVTPELIASVRSASLEAM